MNNIIEQLIIEAVDSLFSGKANSAEKIYLGKNVKMNITNRMTDRLIAKAADSMFSRKKEKC